MTSQQSSTHHTGSPTPPDISPEVIEAAIENFFPCAMGKEAIYASMRRAIRAADEARGLKEEFLKPESLNKLQSGQMVRLVSDWRPVDEE